jgi:hypothetical protein
VAKAFAIVTVLALVSLVGFGPFDYWQYHHMPAGARRIPAGLGGRKEDGTES